MSQDLQWTLDDPVMSAEELFQANQRHDQEHGALRDFQAKRCRTCNIGNNIIGKALTDRKINQYTDLGYFSAEDKQARKAMMEKKASRKNSREGNFDLVDGRMGVQAPMNTIESNWTKDRHGNRVWIGPSSSTYREVREYLALHGKPSALPDAERMLWAQNDFFTAAAIYQRKSGFWTCRETAPCLAFLRGRTPQDGKLELLKRGYRWQWDNNFEQGHRNTAASQSPLAGVIEPRSDTVEPRT